jgi:hypothetical protein
VRCDLSRLPAQAENSESQSNDLAAEIECQPALQRSNFACSSAAPLPTKFYLSLVLRKSHDQGNPQFSALQADARDL